MREQQECVLSAHIAASNSGTEQQQWVLSVPLFETAMCAWHFLPQLQVKQAHYKEQRDVNY